MEYSMFHKVLVSQWYKYIMMYIGKSIMTLYYA